MLSDPGSVKRCLKGCLCYQVSTSSLRTSRPNSDMNALIADETAQTAFVWHRLLWKCWSRPKNGLFNLISSLALSSSFLFPETFLVTVGLSISAGNVRAGYQSYRVVVCPGWLREAGFCFYWLQGEGMPEFRMSTNRRKNSQCFSSVNLYDHASCKVQRSVLFQKNKMPAGTRAWQGRCLKLKIAKLFFSTPKWNNGLSITRLKMPCLLGTYEVQMKGFTIPELMLSEKPLWNEDPVVCEVHGPSDICQTHWNGSIILHK